MSKTPVDYAVFVQVLNNSPAEASKNSTISFPLQALITCKYLCSFSCENNCQMYH